MHNNMGSMTRNKERGEELTDEIKEIREERSQYLQQVKLFRKDNQKLTRKILQYN